MIEKCERCGNENEGDSVYYCRKCKTHFCDECLGKAVGGLSRSMSKLMYHSFCPECSDGGYIGNVGSIHKKHDSDEESAQEETKVRDAEEPSEPSSYAYSSSHNTASSDKDGSGWMFLKVFIFLIAIAIVYASLENSKVSAPPAANTAPIATAVVKQLDYPIHETIALNQDRWSDLVSLNADERCSWRLLEEDVWVDTRINNNEEFRQFPLNDSRWRSQSIQGMLHSIQFRVAGGTKVQTATMQLTRRRITDSESDIYPAVRPGPLWPSELAPTREDQIPPANYFTGSPLGETINPLEDILYRIPPGWIVKPFTESSSQEFEAAADPLGFRIRLLNPNISVFIKFNVQRQPNQYLETNIQEQRVIRRNQNATSMPPNSHHESPTYYPTAPNGPTYYPSAPRGPIQHPGKKPHP